MPPTWRSQPLPVSEPAAMRETHAHGLHAGHALPLAGEAWTELACAIASRLSTIAGQRHAEGVSATYGLASLLDS